MGELTDPIFLTFIVGLLACSLIIALGKSKQGVESTKIILNGSIGFAILGLISSAWTWVIYNSMINPTGATYCATEGIIQCGTLIGDPRYNNMFGVSWGTVGIISFTTLFFLALSIRMDIHAKWVENYIKWAWLVALLGLPFVLILVGIEVVVVQQICPYCTIVHLCLLGYIGSVWMLRERRKLGNWY